MWERRQMALIEVVATPPDASGGGCYPAVGALRISLLNGLN